jgi:methionine biosynthesis protein MetW
MIAPHRAARPRLDYELIEALVPDSARVLDLGCGDGALLAALIETKRCVGRGIEIDDVAVQACVQKGLPVYHGDMLEGMSFYRDGQFDVVILSQTLQQTLKPPQVIREMLRVGRQAIISFPNFGHALVRLGLLFSGRMPRTRMLPYHWFNTPNVHLCTVKDFREFCDREGLRRVREIFVSPSNRPIASLGANWRAGLAIFQIEKGAAPSAECEVGSAE